jgi:hypothetical protein
MRAKRFGESCEIDRRQIAAIIRITDFLLLDGSRTNAGTANNVPAAEKRLFPGSPNRSKRPGWTYRSALSATRCRCCFAKRHGIEKSQPLRGMNDVCDWGH